MLRVRHAKIVKVSLRVSFRPEPDLAWLRERVVADVEVTPAVVKAPDVIADHGDPYVMPSWRSTDIGTSQLGAATFDDLVDAVVVLERIVPSDVVVVGILRSPHGPAALIDPSADGLERNSNVDVLHIRITHESDVERPPGILRELGKDVVVTRSSGVLHDFPLSNFTTEAFRNESLQVVVEIPYVGAGGSHRGGRPGSSR